ncbi:MAG: sodium:proton antiporter [Kiritimatiellae bacterium]|nr:sodium:proton antiporter [Kiritimatiellia bacterium]MDW8457783.1 MnhB domain-containing protein [Verrucomicrobiota bacterium]
MSASRAYAPLPIRIALALGLLPLLAALLHAVGSIPPRPPDLSAALMARMPESGVEHPLTAVLLNFRGYDTLLEMTVLWLAALGALSLASGPSARRRRPHAALVGLIRILAPALVMSAGYILWAGGFRPGGAFQAGSVLGAGLVLASLSGIVAVQPGVALSAGLALGTTVFAGVAAWSWALTGELLHFPAATDKWAILAIESASALSIALILLALFDRLTASADPAESSRGGEMPKAIDGEASGR